jgi:predicted nucleotide-binding protein
MTYEEIFRKLTSCSKLKIIDTSDIQFGRKICLDNGAIVNCYNTGKYSIQGKEQEEVKKIIDGSAFVGNRKVFVVYGHDEMSRTRLEAMLRRWDLEPII